MAKRILSALLAAAFLLLGGCSSLFQKEYLSVEKYTEEEHNEYWGDTVSITNYREFLEAINSMVKNHAAEERFHITNYDGDITAIRDDFFRAQQEIQYETALGSFAVSHISNDGIIQIITHYEVTVHISYKRTQEEIAAISYIAGLVRLEDFFAESLSSLDNYCAVRMNLSDIAPETVLAAVNDAFYKNPAACVLKPEVSVVLHPAEGFDRIIEVNLSYGRSASRLTLMREELTQAIYDIYMGISAPDERAFALEAYNTLASLISYDPDGAIRKSTAGLDQALGGSVYGALVDRVSDSFGIALAYSAICREAGIECLVVTGTYDKLDHSWNMIKLGDNYYHVDVSADSALGITGAFGRSDEQMNGYWWFIEDYPEALDSIDLVSVYTP